MNYYICPYQLACGEIWYTNPDGLAPEEVLFDVIREDFLTNNQLIVFCDKQLKHSCSHKHLQPPTNGIALLKIANRRLGEDEQQMWNKFSWEDRCFATVFVVSRKGATCIYMEENKKAFANAEELFDVVCRGFNDILNRKNLALGSSGGIVTQSDNYGIMCLSAVINNRMEMMAKQEKNTPRDFDEKRLLASQLFASSQVDAYKASIVIQTLYRLTQSQTEINRKLCVLNAALDAGVMVRPPYKAYVTVFDCEQVLTKSKYSRRTNPRLHQYQNDPLYKNAYKEFSKIKTLDF